MREKGCHLQMQRPENYTGKKEDITSFACQVIRAEDPNALHTDRIKMESGMIMI